MPLQFARINKIRTHISNKKKKFAFLQSFICRRKYLESPLGHSGKTRLGKTL